MRGADSQQAVRFGKANPGKAARARRRRFARVRVDVRPDVLRESVLH